MLKKYSITGRHIVLLAVLVYAVLALTNINYPGLNTDEAANGVASTNILRDASDINAEKAPLLGAHLIIGGKIFPLTQSQYSGALMAYLAYPFIRVFGANAVALRMCCVLVMAIFVVLVYRLCRDWFGANEALLASLFTAVNLSFVQYSRLGLYRCEIFVAFFFWAGLYFLARYARQKRRLFLILSFFSWGLSLSVKVTFLFFAAAFAVAYMLVGRKEQVLGKFKIKDIPLMLLSFCCGSILIIIYNVVEPWAIFKQLGSVLLNTGATAANTIGQGANNWDYLNNLGQRCVQYLGLLKGDLAEQYFWGVNPVPEMGLFFALGAGLAVLSLAGLAALAMFCAKIQLNVRLRLLFLYIVFTGVFLLTPFTLSGFNQGHLVVMFPFAQIVLAVFLCRLPDVFASSRTLVKAAAILLAVFTILFNIFTNLYYNIQMRSDGGSGRWSSAVNELADYLEKNGIASPVMFDYDLHANLIFLTQNKVVPVIYDKFFEHPLSKLVGSGGKTFYLAIAGENRNLSLDCPDQARPQGSYADAFMRYVEQRGMTVKLEKVFTNRRHCPVYWLYAVY